MKILIAIIQIVDKIYKNGGNMAENKFSIVFVFVLFVNLVLYSCSSDVSSISDVPSGEDVTLRKCTSKAQCNADEECENGFCKKVTLKQCRTKDDCIYPEECVQGVCKSVNDAGLEDVLTQDVITDISLGGRILAEPSSIDFGAMQFGETKKKTLRIKNGGTADIVIYNFELDSNADTKTFSISSSFTKNTELKPDESFEIEVSCTQTDAEPDNTSIIITSSDSESSTLRVPVYNKYKDKPNLLVKYKTIFGVDKTFPNQGDQNEILYDMGNTALDAGKNINTVEIEIMNNAEEGIFKIDKVTDFINTKNKFEYKFFNKISNQDTNVPIYLSGKESIFLIVTFTASQKSNNDTMDLNIYTNDMDVNNDGSESENGLLIVRFNTRAGIFPATLWTSENFIDFGQVKLLDTAHRQLQICNKGDEDLIIYNTSRVLGSKFTLTPSNIEKVLLTNLCYNVDIAFTPLTEGLVEDTLQINSNDPEKPEYSIGLKGEGISCIKQSDTDDPDDGFVDANCDGIDGEISKAIFVDVQSGSDSNSGDIKNPLKSIGSAISKASSMPQIKYILISEGNYYETFTVNKPISIYGGYSRSNNWQRSDSYKVNIFPSQEGIKLSDITSVIVFDRLNISSQDAINPSSSSYGMMITNSSNVKIHKCSIKAGRGSNGSAGMDGNNGANNDPSVAKGKSGTPGCEDSGGVLCTNCSKPLGGAGGTSACGMNGGRGGDAGRSSNYGQNGEAGIGPSGSGGAGGLGGPPERGSASPLSSQYGQNGADGSPGKSGNGGLNVGTFSQDGYIATNNGLDGEDGTNGAGGGGGGGGGGGTADCDSYGSSGGGGGAGGCGGKGGKGGTGGGASIGIYLFNSVLEITDSTVSSQNGGNGGRGGNGGTGSIGGAGGEGGGYGGTYEQDDGSMGGPGGSGGKGGNGGAGGGGGGGPSISIYKGGTSTLNQSGTSLTKGSGGSGGYSMGNMGQNGISTEIYP